MGKERGSFLGGGGSFDNSIVGNGILNREVSKIEKSIKKWKTNKGADKNRQTNKEKHVFKISIIHNETNHI